MDRKDFIKKSMLGAAGIVASSSLLKGESSQSSTSTYDKLIDQVGFNHLPNTEETTMQSVLHRANTRGHANHGWLDSHHTFSFANYYNPERMNFGVLRVLNDDVVAGGRGFNTHPHDNMEIISIPLSGDLQHKDSMGNTAIIKQGDIQVMSAGTGIKHSEYNNSPNQEVRFLQIWMFPNAKNVEPRYDQLPINPSQTSNRFEQVLSPSKDDSGVWVHQNAWFHIGDLENGCEESYQVKSKDNGVYAFILEGNVEIEGQDLSKRDGYGLWDIDTINIKATTDAKVLLMDVPMSV